MEGHLTELLQGDFKALVGQSDRQALDLPRVIGEKSSEHCFKFVVAAGR